MSEMQSCKKEESPGVKQFLSKPLAIWFANCITSFTEEELTFEELVKGDLIHNVFLQMGLKYRDIEGSDSYTDFAIILSNIRQFYEDELGQIILRMPDARHLDEFNIQEVELLLHLLLDCAVQCPRNKIFITNILELDESVQASIRQYIEMILRYPNVVLDKQMLASIEKNDMKIQELFDVVRSICQERDSYKDEFMKMKMKFDEEDRLGELLEWKTKAKIKSQEILELKDELLKYEQELEDSKEDISRLLQNIKKLELEVRDVRFYKDELDIANEKSDRLGREMNCWKKKFETLTTKNNRATELEIINKSLTDDKERIKENFYLYKAKAEKLEIIVSDFKRQIVDLKAQNKQNLKKYKDVSEEKIHLLSELKKSSNGIASMENRNKYDLKTQHYLKENKNPSNNIKLENKIKIASEKLDADNANFSSLVDSLRNKCVYESSAKVLVLQKENQKLVTTVKSLRDDLKKSLDENEKLQKREFERLQNVLQHKHQNRQGNIIRQEERVKHEVWKVYNSRKLIIKKE